MQFWVEQKKILGSYREPEKRQDFTTVKFIWKNSSIRDIKAEPWGPLSCDYCKKMIAFVKKRKNEMIAMVPINPKVEYLQNILELPCQKDPYLRISGIRTGNTNHNLLPIFCIHFLSRENAEEL